jgi:hypothetical protein
MREYTYSSFFENDNQRERGGGEASSASLSPLAGLSLSIRAGEELLSGKISDTIRDK